MTRSAWTCRGCGYRLGQRHRSGRLHARSEVVVYVDLQGRAGPSVRLVCPACGRHRDYLDGTVVVRPSGGDGQHTTASSATSGTG